MNCKNKLMSFLRKQESLLLKKEITAFLPAGKAGAVMTVLRDSFKRTLYILTISLLLVSGISTAQPGSGKEKIESLKIAFITKRLDLTSKEAQQFWPLYNEYNDKIKAIKKNLFPSGREQMDFFLYKLNKQK